MTDTASLTDVLADHLRRHKGRPGAVFREIALSGDWGSRGRLDVVKITVQPNYAGIRVDGFEVKVSRSDLARDLDAMKWRKYLAVCDTLTFVTPAGLAAKEDVPSDAGLAVVGNDGVSVHTVRRAPLHDQSGRDDAQVLMRTIWRRADNAHGRCCSAAERLGRMRLMADDDPANLPHRLNGQIRDLIYDVQRRESALGWREQELNQQAERIANDAAAAGAAPEVLDAVVALVDVAKWALKPHWNLSEAAREVLTEAADDINQRVYDRRDELVDTEKGAA